MRCKTPFYVKVFDTGNRYQDYVLVPCGHCPDCLRSKASAWAFRLEQENKSALSSYFITLTYDDENLPEDLSVNKEDVQKFFKRLRKCFSTKFKLPIKLRYFLVSEYGDSFGRPHYHFLCFFNHRVSLIDCMTCVSNSWNKGRIDVGNVTPASIRYCSKYCLKQENKPTRFIDFETGNITELKPTFTLMSRRPAIGSNFLTPQMKEYLSQGVFSLQVGPKEFRSIPRIYKEKAIPKEIRRTHTIEIMKEHFDELESSDWSKDFNTERFHIHHNKQKLLHDKIRK